MQRVLLLLALASLFCCSCYGAVAVAQAKLTPTTDYGAARNVTGTVTFTLNPSGEVEVNVNISGDLGTAEYAIHVHQYGDLSDLAQGKSAGSHYIGTATGSATHGCPPSTDRHEGDMGNWNATAGSIVQSKTLDLLTLSGSVDSIIGAAVVMHEHEDNCTGPTGYAGNFLAVGVIGIIDATNNTAGNNNTGLTSAYVALQPTSNGNANMSGSVWFETSSDGVRVVAQIAGLEEGSLHGFHIHTYGDLTGSGGLNAGPHWNPNQASHGLPDADRHVGDLGMIQSYDSLTGLAYYDATLDNIPSVHSLIGRSVAVHSGRDHGSGNGCDQAGNSGKRIMLGVIGAANPSNTPVPIPITVNNNYTNKDCVSGSATLTSPLSLLFETMAF